MFIRLLHYSKTIFYRVPHLPQVLQNTFFEFLGEDKYITQTVV